VVALREVVLGGVLCLCLVVGVWRVVGEVQVCVGRIAVGSRGIEGKGSRRCRTR